MQRFLFLFLVLLSASAAPAALTEQQTVDAGINGSAAWVASFGTAPEQVRSDNGYLSIAGRGGAGQYFDVNGKSKYQIATATALKASNWGAIGVTYYDTSWNEVHVVRKEITDDLRFGGQESRYAIGIVPPANAAFGFLWVWNDDPNGYTQVDDFRLMNYFPEGNVSFDGSQPSGDQYSQTFPSDRNLLINGEFETPEFEGDEFWNVMEINDSVYFQERSVLGGDFGLHIGAPSGPNLISQATTELEGGKDYSILITGGRMNSPGQAAPWAIVGVDYFDQNWNKLGSNSTAITNNISFDSRRPFDNDTILALKPPAGTVNSVVWVWVEAGDSPLWLRRLYLTVGDTEPPYIDGVFVSDGNFGTPKYSFGVSVRDNDRVDTDTQDGNDFKLIGPSGQERSVTFRRPSQYGAALYRPGTFTSADNGTWAIYYNPGEIADASGNTAQLPFPGATSQIVAYFEVDE